MASGYQQMESDRMLRWNDQADAPPREDAPVCWQVLTWLLFWPLLCLIARQAPYFAGPARDATFYTQGAASGQGADYHASLYVILVMQTAFAISAKRKIWKVLKENPLILAGLLLVCVSLLWSGSAVNTIHMGVELSLCTMFACYLAVRMPTERLMSLLMFMGVAASALSIVFALAIPRYGIFAGYGGGAWQGIADHKNTLGVSMTYLLTPVFFAQKYRLFRRVAYGALILFIIVMSQSRGAWMYTAGVLFFVGFLCMIRHLRRQEAILLVVVAMVAGAVASVIAVHSFDNIAPLLGKDSSMSGRTEIYRQAWLSILKKPAVGYGYGGFWGVSPEAARIGLSIGWNNVAYSESGILELALQLGFAGVGLVLFTVGRAVVQAIRLFNSSFYSPRAGWFLTILFLAALTNIDAGWLMVPGSLDWVMILIACVGLEGETRRARQCSVIAQEAWGQNF